LFKPTWKPKIQRLEDEVEREELGIGLRKRGFDWRQINWIVNTPIRTVEAIMRGLGTFATTPSRMMRGGTDVEVQNHNICRYC
jgi:hypothetical protein